MAPQEKPAFDCRACCRVFWLNPRLHNSVAILVFFAAILGWNYTDPIPCWSVRHFSFLVLLLAVIVDILLLVGLAVKVLDEPWLVYVTCAHAVLAQAIGTLTSSWWCLASDGPNLVTALGGSLLVLGIYAVLGIAGGAVLFVASFVHDACRAALAAGRAGNTMCPTPIS